MAYRIDDRTAVSLLPAPKTTGTGQPGFFTAGDPQTGEGATVVTDDWLNMVQEELISVVQAAGIALDKTDRGQLLAAIRKFVNASLPVNNPAVQGTLTAGIFAAPGNGSQNLNLLYGPGLSYRLAGQNDGNLVVYVNNSPFLSISPKGMTFNGNTVATAGDLAALAARMQPMGNYVTAGNRGPTKTYNFDVVAAHGDWISFPDPFSGDAVAVVPVAQDTGNNQIHTSSWFRKDRSGFQLSCNVWTGSTWANEHNGVPVAVAVTGPA